ncbi:hypothetical protein Ct9H90mP29_08460 [bacterium]|nr:MAG: hypothetical protein Ct9H90mP29_08460 [bacterium]
MPRDIVYQKKIEGLAPRISFYSLIKMDDSQTTGLGVYNTAFILIYDSDLNKRL